MTAFLGLVGTNHDSSLGLDADHDEAGGCDDEERGESHDVQEK